ncbi:MAG: hypothetical protein BGO76_00485 [Caedibacter sp. 38-128]|nr:MAG: hypothetical protein BGO76_00485 [Caedibacter sp. 38-128]
MNLKVGAWLSPNKGRMKDMKDRNPQLYQRKRGKRYCEVNMSWLEGIQERAMVMIFDKRTFLKLWCNNESKSRRHGLLFSLKIGNAL